MNIGDLNISNSAIEINWATVPTKNPNNTALGDPNPYVAAQSTAGNDPGKILFEIPWNDTVSSDTNILTPVFNIVK